MGRDDATIRSTTVHARAHIGFDVIVVVLARGLHPHHHWDLFDAGAQCLQVGRTTDKREYIHIFRLSRRSGVGSASKHNERSTTW